VFSELLNVIKSADLRRVAEHWQAARGARAMPGWSDIKPSAIAVQLPIVWSYKFDSATGEFTGRLAGERIARMFGKDFRGTPMVDLQPAADFPWVYAMCKRVASEPALHHGAGFMYRHLAKYGKGERVIMPLASDGVAADGILGATDYQLETGDAQSLSSTEPEIEEWFRL
jgi:hypothetical protein